MASILEALNIKKEILDQVEPEEVYEGKTLPAGLYDAAIEQAYIRKTDSGANMLEIDFQLDDGKKFHYSTCVLSGDEKGNKSTYTTKQGKEVALPGVVSMTKFLTAIDGLNTGAVEGEIMHRDQKIKALAFEGIQGKKLKIGINQEENFYNGDVLIKNDVKYWLDENGKNSKGEDLTDKVKESLEKHPLKKLRGAQAKAANVAPATQGSESAPKGW